MAYIDTSVLVAYYCPEPLSDAAERAIRQADRPTISALVEVEFCSALAIKMRTGDMDMESAQRILSCFRMHIADRLFTIVPIAAREYAAACQWIGAFAVPLRTVDALHLAAAFANELAVLTADKALARSAEHFGVACQLIT
jgi:predicted nucleic acid-binding protein